MAEDCNASLSLRLPDGCIRYGVRKPLRKPGKGTELGGVRRTKLENADHSVASRLHNVDE